MKIHLEHRLSSCPPKLRCTVCQQVFTVGRIRSLLLNNRGLIQGDVCPDCVHLPSNEIRLLLADQARLMLEQPSLFQPQVASPEALALELFEASQEEVKFPTLYQWFVKTIEGRFFLNPDEEQMTVEAIAAFSHTPWHRKPL
jgi:hypothetical protein